MSGQRFVLPYQTVIDAAGVPLPGAKLFFYASGTDTPLDTYSDFALTVPNANPVVALDDGQFGNIFLQGLPYKVVLEDSLGAEIWTGDPVISGSPSYQFLNVANLRLNVLPAISMPIVVLEGYYAAADQGGGTFIYVASDTTSADNGGTIIVDAANQRWYRQIPGPISPKFFGAVGDGVTDDNVALATMVAFADIVATKSNIVIFEASGYIFATSQPFIAPSFTITRVNLRALPSASWILGHAALDGNQDGTGNGLWMPANGANTIWVEDCIIDGNGYDQSGNPVTVNVNSMFLQPGSAGNIRFNNVRAINPSALGAAIRSLGNFTATACNFQCIDAGGTPTYTGYGLFLDWFDLQTGGKAGADDTLFIGCQFQHGLFPVHGEPGTFSIQFISCHPWTGGGGTNAYNLVDCWGHNWQWVGTYHESQFTFTCGGTYNLGGILQTEDNADFMISASKTGFHPADAYIVINTTLANTTATLVRIDISSRFRGSLPTVKWKTSGAGTWSTVPVQMQTAMNAEFHGLLTVFDHLPVYAIGASNNIILDLHSSDPEFCLISFNADGYSSLSNPPPQVGSDKSDIVVRTSGNAEFRVVGDSAGPYDPSVVVSTNPIAAVGMGQGVSLFRFGQISPNDTTSTFLICNDSTQARLKIYSNGNVVNVNNSYGVLSDERTKTDVIPAAPSLDRIVALKPVEYTSKFDPHGQRLIGFLAHEAQEVFPDIVGEDGSTEERLKHVYMSRLIPHLVGAIQELRAEVSQLKAERAGS